MKAKARFAFLAAFCAAVLLLPASAAAETVTVNLAGSAEGTVVSSSPAGIECSNVGGGTPGPTCSAELNDFVDFTALLTATPAEGAVLVGWTVTSGSGSRCTTPPQADPTCQPSLFGTFEVTASFGPAPDPPLAATDDPSDATDIQATMSGRANPNGTAVTSCRFEYGTTTAYGATMPCTPKASELGSGNADIAVSATTEALEPGTTYHYRLAAGNPGGTSVGADRTFTTTGTPPCPNADIRRAQGIVAILLPECMALEMVSPPKKFNQEAKIPRGISADGDRVVFTSTAALAETPSHLDAFGIVYVTIREPSGWETTSTSPPPSIALGGNPISGSFTPDFSRWVHLPLVKPDQAPLGIAQAYVGGLGGLLAPLSPPLVPANATFPQGPETFAKGTRFQAASADHSHVYLRPNELSASFLSSDPKPAGTGADFNRYVAHLDSNGDPSAELIARDADGKLWGGNCGTRIGGIEGPNGGRNQGAVSADGTRVYFSTRPSQPEGANCDTATHKLRLMQRLETPGGPWIKELVKSECVRLAPACSTANGDDFYQGASVDGTKVYFTTTRQLADSDLDTGTACSATLAQSVGCDLYLYDTTKPIGQRLTQVSAGELVPGVNPGDPPIHAVGSGANVLNAITAISGDGSRVYFAAKGRLTNSAGPKGNNPTVGQPNLYAWDVESEKATFAGTLASSDSSGWVWGGIHGTFRNQAYPVPATGIDTEGKEIGGDGHILFFQSNAPLTADDVDGGSRDIFRYDAKAAPPTLVHVSKATLGGSDSGAFPATTAPLVSDPPGTDFAESSRWVSENGETVLFSTNEGLVPGDVDGTRDTYLWKEGSLSRVPDDPTSNTSGLQLSHDGSTVAFETASQLLPQDGDTVKDIYVARAGGGFPLVVEPPPCPPDADEGCQGRAADAPASDRSASAAFSGTGNVKPEGQNPGRRCPKGKRVVRRAGKARCVGKKQVQRKKKAHRQQRAGREQGGRK